VWNPSESKCRNIVAAFLGPADVFLRFTQKSHHPRVACEGPLGYQHAWSLPTKDVVESIKKQPAMSNSSDAENPYAVRSETEASEYSDRDAPKVIEVSGSYRPEDIKRTPRLFKVYHTSHLQLAAFIATGYFIYLCKQASGLNADVAFGDRLIFAARNNQISFLVVGLVCLLLLWNFWKEKKAERKEKTEGTGRFALQSLKLTAEGLQHQSNLSSTEYQWSAFASYNTSDTHLAFRFSNRNYAYLCIPRWWFDSDFHWNQFLVFVEVRVPVQKWQGKR